MRFNPRARVGRDNLTTGASACKIGFNPRARVGRDVKGKVRLATSAVSIHAPAWGATASAFEYCVVLSLCFNPRARVGRDSNGKIKGAINDVVSIHAPAWGATIAQALRDWC